MNDLLEGLQVGDVVVVEFGSSLWVAPVVEEPFTTSMYRDNNPTRVVRVAACRGQFGRYADRDGDTFLAPLSSIVAF